MEQAMTVSAYSRGVKRFTSQKLLQTLRDSSQVLGYSILLSHLTFVPYMMNMDVLMPALAGRIGTANAGPTDGVITGGSGSISQSSLTTTISQTSQNMAIDWQSYNVNVDERVHYIQPNSSSISLNRILSNSGSTIAGRIDANGQVILVNPNGVFFTPTSQINVGGIIASGLDISTSDFMNGDYIFNEVLGSDGSVINSGTINASLGGNVALLGRSVENNGLISANLGTVNLAAGKQAVLTFDNNGLLGVRISQEILQDELGVDPAVLNSGEIHAAGGRVLLTGSVSHDVFSQAVNTGDMQQASSVVVNADGSFTLGNGADVVNTGTVDVSTQQGTAGQIVMLGENITSSGIIKANANSGNGGHIELHANDITELTDNSTISARAETNGIGGQIKILGDKIGLFDQSVVDASGALGGGTVLIGGDREGKNNLVRNASFVYLNNNSKVMADALNTGQGGKLIAFAEDSARIYGGLYARGGINGGDGGFIETSGKRGFKILNAPDVSAALGKGGLWLIDPFNITIQNSGTEVGFDTSPTSPPTVYTSTSDTATINVSTIYNALLNGDVEIITDDDLLTPALDGDITFDADLDYDGTGSNTLTLNASNDILFYLDSSILDGDITDVDSLNIHLIANGDINLLTTTNIQTNGGDFTVGDTTNGIIPISFTNNGTVNTTGGTNTDGGDIAITTSGSVTSSATSSLIANGGVADRNGGAGVPGLNGGNITINATDSVALGNLSSIGTIGDYRNNSSTDIGQPGGAGGIINITSVNSTIAVNGTINISGGNGSGDNDSGNGNDPANGGNAGNLLAIANNGLVRLNAITANGGTAIGTSSTGGDGGLISITGSSIQLNSNISTTGGTVSGTSTTQGNGGNINFSGPVTLTGATAMQINASGYTRGDISFSSTLNDNDTTPVALTLTGRDITFGDAVGNLDKIGALTINSTRDVVAGINNITSNSLTVSQSSSFSSGAINTSSTTGNGGLISIASGGAVNTGDLNSSSTNGNGGSITVTSSGSVTVGTLNSRSTLPTTGSGGSILINANEITLNGDIDSRGNGGTTPVTTLSLTTDGTVNINHNTDFSSAIALTGSSGTNDTINAANRTNNWALTDSDSGTLNSNFSFSAMENLTGNDGQDTFQLTNSGAFAGFIDGAGGSLDEVIGGARSNAWDITSANGGSVTGLDNDFSNIEILTGGSNNDAFQLHDSIEFDGSISGGSAGADEIVAGNQNNNWEITGLNNTGTVTGLSGSFSNIDTLTGNTQNDVFQLNDIVDFTGSINGVSGTNDEVIGGNRTNVWTITGNNNTGTVTGLSGGTFSNIDILTGNNGQDTFSLHASENFAGSINGAGGILDEIVGGNRNNDWVITDTNNTGTVTGLGSTFSNIEILTGNAARDRLQLHDTIDFSGSFNGAGGTSDRITGGNRPNTWTITGIDNTGTVTGLNNGFSNVETLLGNANQDSYYLNDNATINFSGSIDGAGGATDQLFGGDRANTWTITGLNTGNVTGLSSTFTNIENLIGGTNTDNFNYQSGGSISGSVDGSDGLDSVNQSSLSNVNIDLDSGDYLNIEDFIGNNNNSILTASSATANTWLIDSPYSGEVFNGTDTITFSNFHIINGGALQDNYTVDSTISTINAGAGNDSVTVNSGGVIDTVNLGDGDDVFTINGTGTVVNVNGDNNNDTFYLYGGNSNIQINGGNGIDFAGYTGVTPITVGSTATGLEGVNASNGAGTLVAQNGETTTWTIDGTNRGQLTDTSGQDLYFTGFSTLIGGDGDDNFTITRNVPNNTNGSITGSISGNDGTNTLIVQLSGTETGQVNYIGTIGDDTVRVTGTTGIYNAEYNPGAAIGDYDQFIYTSSVNTPYTVNYRDVDTVQSQRSLNELVVNGTAANETISLGTGIFTVGTHTPVNYSNVNNLTVSGTGDAVELVGDITLSGTLRLAADTVSDIAGATLTTNTIVLDNVNQFGSSSALINTSIDTLQLINTGPVFINESNGLNLNTSGTVTNSGIFNISGTTNINAGGGSLTLDNAANDFDTVNASNTNQLTLRDVDSINGGSIAANSITLQTANGVGAAGNPLLTQTANLDITNTNSNGVFVENNQAVTVSITNIDDIEFTNTSGNVTVERLYTNGGNYDPSINVYNGDVYLEARNGGSIYAYRGLGSHSALDAPDIVAENLYVTSVNFFGEPDRYMSIRVNETFSFIGISGFVYYYGNDPRTLIGVDDLIDFSNLAASAFNQKLVEVESLADLDPAIFTALRNYSYDDQAIRMPADQRYDDDEL